MNNIDETISLDFTEDRYSRFKLISWWDQANLANAKILVVGAGAIGNEIIKNLALLGVGNIYIVDIDKIEHSNLTRSVLFRLNDVGKYKAEVAAIRASEINPDVKAKHMVANVIDDIGLGFFRDMDVVLGGLDNREARLAINQFCFKVGTPWIDGAIEVLDGFVRVFSATKGACYECTMSALDWKLLNKRKSCALLSHEQIAEGKIPTTPTSSSIIAGIEVQEMLKLLHLDRNLPNLIGRGYVFNGLTHDSYTVEYERKDDCMSHDTLLNIITTSWSFKDKIMDVFSELRLKMGEGVFIELDRDILTEANCTCGYKKGIYKPVHKAKFSDLVCERCDKQMSFETTHILDNHFSHLEFTFEEIGIPAYHIIMARNSADIRYFEFSADRSNLLKQY